MAAELTARQQLVWLLILAHSDRYGEMPTIRHLCGLLSVNSPNAVEGHLQALARRGLLDKRHEHGRAGFRIAETDEAKPCPAAVAGRVVICGRVLTPEVAFRLASDVAKAASEAMLSGLGRTLG